MNKHLKEIIELSGFDKTLDEFGPREEAIRSKINALEERVRILDDATLKVEENVKDLGYKKAKHDNLIKELSDKISDIEKKYTQIKSDKELKALQVEEEIAREQITFANEEIERFDKLTTRENEKKAELEGQKTELSIQIEEAKSHVQEQLDIMEKAKAKAYEERSMRSASINPGILSFYQKVRRWAKNTAVVTVKKQACMGCYMVINDKTYAAVVRGEEIVTCPSCGRILYIEEALNG